MIALAGSVVAGLAAAGLTYGVAAHDIGGKLAAVVGSPAVQLPTVCLLSAATAALFSLLPRFNPVAWGLLVEFIVVYRLRSLSGFPQSLLELEPFAHIMRVCDGIFSPMPLLWPLAIGAALTTLGFAAVRRCDVRC
jgi:ABC-2 type transport system permease protein